jgi:hypothetical protein
MGSEAVENQRKSWSGRVLWVFGVWWTFWLEFSAKLGSKMEQNEPSRQQVAPKSHQDAAKMASLVTFYVLLKRFLSNIL